MNEKYKDSFKIIHSNNENMKDIIKAEVIDDSDYRLKNSMTTSSSRSPCIIRIVPSKKISISTKNGFKTLTVKRAEYLKTTPSTSQSKTLVTTLDHEYVNKSIDSDVSDEIKEYEKSTSNQIVTSPNSQSDKINEQTLLPNALKRPTDNDFIVEPEKKSKIHSEKCCCTCRDILEDVQKKQEEILNYLKKGYLFTNRERKLDLLPNMPFHDVNDFLDFDESLTHENVQDQFLIKLRKLLVSAEQKSVSNIMSSIMTNELCRGISWIGIKDTLAFGSTNMVMLIVDLLQEHHQLEIDVVKARIAEWLRRCGDRIGNEIRKQKKKEEQRYSFVK